jgi:antitoxin HigA-1
MSLSVPSNRRPVTPGEVLLNDFLEALGLSSLRAAEALGVDHTSLTEILNGDRTVTPDLALRLAHAFSTTPLYWLNLQLVVDLYDAEHSPLRDEIANNPVLVPRADSRSKQLKTLTYCGYIARITYDERDGIFVGRVLGVKDSITFHAKTADKLDKEFRVAIDDYLADQTTSP